MVANVRLPIDPTDIRHDYEILIYFCCATDLRENGNVQKLIDQLSDTAVHSEDTLFCFPPKGRCEEFQNNIRDLFAVRGNQDEIVTHIETGSDCFFVRCERDISSNQIKTTIADISKLIRVDLSDANVTDLVRSIRFGRLADGNGAEHWTSALLLKPSFFGFGVDFARLWSASKSRRSLK